MHFFHIEQKEWSIMHVKAQERKCLVTKKKNALKLNFFHKFSHTKFWIKYLGVGAGNKSCERGLVLMKREGQL